MNEIKELRLKTGLSQKEAAKVLNVAVRTLQDWENGQRNPKEPERIMDILDAMTNLTRQGINAILDGDKDVEWALWEKKISDVRRISKWGAYESIFSANWRRIPTGIKHKLNAEELASLVDAINDAYSDGKESNIR